MTEEIIIDGVNVAGCYYMYDNEDLNYMCQNGIGTCICRENKNCYYKQLKRLQTENAQLKNERTVDLTKTTTKIKGRKQTSERRIGKNKRNRIMNSEFETLLEQLKYRKSYYEALVWGEPRRKDNESKIVLLKPMLQDEYERIGKELGGRVRMNNYDDVSGQIFGEADMYLHFREDTTKREIKEKQNKHKQALEDIRALSLKFISDLDDKYKYEKGLFRIFIRKIDEVLK